MSRDATAATKQRILAAAARLLRERGIEGTSIADVMEAAGMKHGGFYKHFASKEDLIRQAIACAFAERIANFDARKETEGEEAAIRAYVETYLSPAHVDHPGHGCPVAGFGADAGRDREAYSEAFVAGMEALVTRMSGASDAGRDVAIRQLCLMVGALIVARAGGRSQLREDALRSVRSAVIARQKK